MRNAAVLQSEAWKALVKGLGMADALRYRILFESGGGDYSAERGTLFAHMTVDDWVKAMKPARPIRNKAAKR